MSENDDRIDMHLMSVLDEQFNREDQRRKEDRKLRCLSIKLCLCGIIFFGGITYLVMIMFNKN
tara:strand:+ start:1427 stop:1615 length:189 start_codon:yes stop_codon:yes gene_type:complete